MVKVIGAGYGLDFETINFCFKKFNVRDLKIEDIKEKKINQQENLNMYTKEEIELITDIINNIIYNSNKEEIKKIVIIIKELTKEAKSKTMDDHIKNTKAISKICQYIFEKELEETYGLPFFIKYFKKIELLMEDIKYYINKIDWEKDEVEYIEKKEGLLLDIFEKNEENLFQKNQKNY